MNPNIYHIERKSLGEWNDVCLPTRDESLARKICHKDAEKKNGMVRVATYDDREPDAHVVCLKRIGEWEQWDDPPNGSL